MRWAVCMIAPKAPKAKTTTVSVTAAPRRAARDAALRRIARAQPDFAQAGQAERTARVAALAQIPPAEAQRFMLLGLAVWGQPQTVTLLPLLAPLVILAVQGVPGLRRGAAAALDWFGLVTFAFFGGLVWLGYVAMMTGLPPKIAHNFAKTAPGFVPEFNPFLFLVALALTATWIYLMFFTAYSPTRSIARWATGIVLLWGTFATLWMPWADHQKSYRSVALQLRSKIPVGTTCIAQRGLGVPQGASLDYYGDIQPRAFDIGKPRECPLVLVQGSPQHEFDAPGPGWTKLADVGRPGDKGERFRLYRFGK